ncbi:MAG: SBBP repeat-containing protein, partial [Bacteroidia bacterium]|nr:SBBP repeat-containing protein [Bacteroidia bacterium]
MIKKHYLLIFLFLITISLGYSKDTKESFLNNLHAGFIENRGQIVDQTGQVNHNVLYLFRSNNLQVQLRKNGFSYEIFKSNKPSEILDDLGNLLMEMPPQEFTVNRIDIDFLGGNLAMDIEELDASSSQLVYSAKQGNSDSFRPQIFRRVLYKNVYPQIDFEFLIAEEKGKQSFKYNVILHPGADAKLVKLAITGAEKTEVSKNGNLVFSTKGGNFEENIPYSYELKEKGVIGKTIESKYVMLNANTVGFALTQNNTAITRVIDPFVWCTYYGGTSNEVSRNIDIDPGGSILISGITTSTTNIATTGAYQTSLAGSSSSYDLFIAKFTTNGSLVWATYFGGAESEFGLGMTVDGNGNIIVVGQTNSSAGIASTGAYQTTIGGATDGFVAKFNSNGNLVWSTYFGGLISDQINSVAADKFGNIVVTGVSNSGMNISFPGVHQTTPGGSNDAFVLRFDKNGVLRKGSYFAGTGADYASGICVDSDCKIYITGYTNSTSGIATPTAYQGALIGNSDAYIGKFDTNMVLIYATYFGGVNLDYPLEITIDSKGNIDLAGYTYSLSDFPVKNADKPSISSTGPLGFVVQFDSIFNLNFSTYYGGNSTNIIFGMTLDGADNIYVTGYTNSTTGIATSGAYQANLRSVIFDGMIACFTSSGSLSWSTYFGGENADYLRKLAVDKSNNLFVLGDSYSDSFIYFGSVHQSTRSGGDEAILIKITLDIPSGNLGNNTIGTDQTLCGSSIANDLIGSTPTGGTGSYSYTWLQSPTGLDGSYVGANGTNSNKDYSPGSIVAETYYKRVVTDGSAFDTSNAVIIKIGSTFKAGFTVNKTIQCLRSNQFIFTDTTSATGLTYDWDFGNGATSTNQSETISYA